MATLKTRSLSADRHRRVHIQTVAGQNSTAPIASDPSEELPSPNEELPVISLVAELPPVEIVAPKPVSDLALDLVLNEIALQARLTSNATGAVIALGRSRKLICRATTGATSSEIAAFLNIPSGVSITCFETGAVQRVDDVNVAPGSHADAAAYQRASVRSILVVPISNDNDQILGILQSFSPRPNAFCDRDVLTLQALARRIATNIELVKKSCGVDAPKIPLPLTKSSAINTPRHAPSPSRFQFRTPQFFSRLLTKRRRIMPANWAAMFGKTALVLLLLATCVTAGRFWIRNRGTAKSAAVHRSSQLPVQRTANVVTSKVPRTEVTLADAKPTVPTPAPSRQQVPKSRIRSPKRRATSITIERKPIHKGITSSVNEETAADKTSPSSSEIVLFEDKSSAQEPTVKAVAPSPSNSSVEAISTQAALARLVQRVEPKYPNAARQQHIQGNVLLDILVNESGSVVELALASGAPQLMPAAEQAVRQWHFQPLTKSGHTQKFKSRVGINFTLATEGSSQTR